MVQLMTMTFQNAPAGAINTDGKPSSYAELKAQSTSSGIKYGGLLSTYFRASGKLTIPNVDRYPIITCSKLYRKVCSADGICHCESRI